MSENETRFKKIARIRNNVDAHHCLQFAFMAAVETLGHPGLTVQEAEVATGFQPGGTWPYTMLTWLADNDFDVVHIENTNFDRFIESPRAEFEAQGLDEATIQLFYEISDFDFERAALERARRHPMVRLEARLPELNDILAGLRNGWLPLMSLDAPALDGDETDNFDGHMVLATGADEGEIAIQDPGPPTRWDWNVSHDRVLRALRTPTDSSGTVTLIRKAAKED